MKISKLVEQHRRFESQGLCENFGDGYLIANNRYYARIRKSALKAKYRFSREKNEAYETFPLVRLEAILHSKVLPYANNMAAFQEMSVPQLENLNWEDAEGNLKKNFVFHEGAHAFTRELADKIMGPAAKPSARDTEINRKFALRMLLEESCANACELLGLVDVHDPIHRIFFEMNSYMANFENRAHLKNAFAEIGEATTIRFLVLAYLQSNLLRRNIDDLTFTEMIIIASGGEKLGDPKKLKTLRAFSKLAFQLSERFRFQTTGFHLRLAGISTPMEKLFDFDALKVFKDMRGSAFLKAFAGELIGHD